MGAAGHGEGSGRWWAGDMVARAAGRGGVRLDGGLLEEDDRQRGREREVPAVAQLGLARARNRGLHSSRKDGKIIN